LEQGLEQDLVVPLFFIQLVVVEPKQVQEVEVGEEQVPALEEEALELMVAMVQVEPI